MKTAAAIDPDKIRPFLRDDSKNALYRMWRQMTCSCTLPEYPEFKCSGLLE